MANRITNTQVDNILTIKESIKIAEYRLEGFMEANVDLSDANVRKDIRVITNEISALEAEMSNLLAA